MIEKLAPPFLGALIGYFTNYVAIKMLFKPTKAYYIFGRKVPFTPGLIPAKRGKLAEAIAKVVKENLLTQESIKERLNEEKVKESLVNLAETFLKEIEENSQTYINDLLNRVRGKKLKELVPLELLSLKAQEGIEGIYKKLNGKRIRELLPEPFKKEIERVINEKLDKLSEGIAKQVKSGQLSEVIYTGVKENLLKVRALFPLITEPIVQNLSRKISSLIEEMVERAASEPSFRMKLSKLLWTKFQEFLSKEINSESEFVKRLNELTKQAVKDYIEGLGDKEIGQLEFLEELALKELPQILGEFLKRNRREIAQLIGDELLKVIERELPVIMEAIDIESMVKNRVNSLPIEDVEEIVLKLIDEELKHITFLGGVLGFLIGLSQIFII